MAGSRYSLIQKAFWQYLGPAYRGLDADVTALEAAAGSGGGGAITWDGVSAAPSRPASGTDVTWIAPAFPSTATTGDYLVRG